MIYLLYGEYLDCSEWLKDFPNKQYFVASGATAEDTEDDQENIMLTANQTWEDAVTFARSFSFFDSPTVVYLCQNLPQLPKTSSGRGKKKIKHLSYFDGTVFDLIIWQDGEADPKNSELKPYQDYAEAGILEIQHFPRLQSKGKLNYIRSVLGSDYNSAKYLDSNIPYDADKGRIMATLNPIMDYCQKNKTKLSGNKPILRSIVPPIASNNLLEESARDLLHGKASEAIRKLEFILSSGEANLFSFHYSCRKQGLMFLLKDLPLKEMQNIIGDFPKSEPQKDYLLKQLEGCKDKHIVRVICKTYIASIKGDIGLLYL